MTVERTGPQDWKLLKEASPRLPLYKGIPESFRVTTGQGWIVNFRLMVETDEDYQARAAQAPELSPHLPLHVDDPWRRCRVSLIDVANQEGRVVMTNRHDTKPTWREADVYRRVCRNLDTGAGHFLAVVEALEAVFARVELPR